MKPNQRLWHRRTDAMRHQVSRWACVFDGTEQACENEVARLREAGWEGEFYCGIDDPNTLMPGKRMA